MCVVMDVTLNHMNVVISNIMMMKMGMLMCGCVFLDVRGDDTCC